MSPCNNTNNEKSSSYSKLTLGTLPLTIFSANREQEHAVTQYAAWQKLRERALRNAPGGKMPSGYVEPPRAPPPPPSAIDDADIMDLSLELNAASIEDVPGDLDEHGIERVPTADPGLDVRPSLEQ